MHRIIGLLTALVVAGTALAQTPAFDPRSLRGKYIGQPTTVLTIGSVHLGQSDQPVTPELVAPLLNKLAAYKPDIITHEGISGEQCETLKRNPAKYPGVFDDYCYGTEEAESATGLTVPAALAVIQATLDKWPTAPSAAQRRQLAAYFLAANDRPSAQVQWLQLPTAERKTGDGIDTALLKILSREGVRHNETYDVAVVLAARLGLKRVYAVDDHTSDSILLEAGSGLEAFLQQHWSTPKTPFVEEMGRQQKAVRTGTDFLNFYRFINRPASLRNFISFDYKTAINTPSAGNYGRVYLAWWEVRNLRMVSNIRSAFGNQPGGRVLNIVGVSHKAYYDAYFDVMSDVTLADAEHVLK